MYGPILTSLPPLPPSGVDRANKFRSVISKINVILTLMAELNGPSAQL
jgi:hypothetical protein